MPDAVHLNEQVLSGPGPDERTAEQSSVSAPNPGLPKGKPYYFKRTACASSWSDTRKRQSRIAGSSCLCGPPCPAPSSRRWEMALGKFHSVIHLSRINRAPALEYSAQSTRRSESTWGLACPWETRKKNQEPGDMSCSRPWHHKAIGPE